MQGSDEQAAWREQRAAAAAVHEEAARRRREAETERARELVSLFAEEALAKGLTPRPLTAGTYSGRGRYRTGIVGWYLRRNRSLGVSTDGGYYVLVVPSSLRGRLSGVTVEPSDPPLQVGAGGRDGDSVALDVLLRLRLEAGDDWP